MMNAKHIERDTTGPIPKEPKANAKFDLMISFLIFVYFVECAQVAFFAGSPATAEVLPKLLRHRQLQVLLPFPIVTELQAKACDLFGLVSN